MPEYPTFGRRASLDTEAQPFQNVNALALRLLARLPILLMFAPPFLSIIHFFIDFGFSFHEIHIMFPVESAALVRLCPS